MFVAYLLDVGVYGPFPTYPSRRCQGIHLSHKHVKKYVTWGKETYRRLVARNEPPQIQHFVYSQSRI